MDAQKEQEMADQEPGILAESNPNSRELPFLCQFTTYRTIKIIGYLICARYCFEHFRCIVSL